jgi:site-specific recombinase XerD
MLTPYRRHLAKCPHRNKGRSYDKQAKCSCPLWCDGTLNGQRYRQDLDTWDWADGMRKCLELQNPAFDSRPMCAQPGCMTRVDAGRCDAHRKTVAAAIAAFQEATAGLSPATRAKNAVTLRELQTHCKGAGVAELHDISLEHLDAFRAGRKLGPLSGLKELERLRRFFGFCVKRKWAPENVARETETPRNIKPAEVAPYEPAEVAKMLAACDGVGRASYERLRARALVLLLRYTGLRITDAITLARDRIHNGRILLHTQKTGGTVFLPVRPELQAALDSLPCPRGTVGEPKYFFWNGTMGRLAVKGIAERTLAAVFKLSGVEGAHAHRFRHTLATEILVMGGSEQDVADILGISAAIVRKHYAKWSQARQRRIDSLMESVYGAVTYPSHANFAADNAFGS